MRLFNVRHHDRSEIIYSADNPATVLDRMALKKPKQHTEELPVLLSATNNFCHQPKKKYKTEFL